MTRAVPNAAHTLATLRRRAAHLYPLRDLDVWVAGRANPYTLALPARPDDPLDRFVASVRQEPEAGLGTDADIGSGLPEAARTTMEAARTARAAVAAGAHMPYWGLLWASGQALAEALLAEPEVARDRRALELGCGLGLTACAALDAGATLWAADCFAEALLFCRYNTLRNTDRTPHTLLLDWRTEAGRTACLSLVPFPLLLAADVLYEQDDIAPLLALAPRLLTPGGELWLAEPGRRVAHAFVEAAYARGWHDRETVFERAWPPDGDVVRVAVHRLSLSERT